MSCSRQRDVGSKALTSRLRVILKPWLILKGEVTWRNNANLGQKTRLTWAEKKNMF